MSTEVYRDDICYAVINEAPVTLGHIRIYPHSQAQSLEEMKESEIAHLFQVANICASILFEGLKAQGTNIVCNNGGDKAVCIEVIARTEGDGIGYIWEPKQGNPAELTETADMIAKKIVPVEVPEQKPIVQESPAEITEEAGKPNLKIEQLRRIP